MKYFILSILFFANCFAQNGIVKTYYTDGTPMSEKSLVNDILDGASFTYYQNGNLQSEKNYSDGILSGYVREFYETGLLKLEYFINNGVKDGTQRLFYENGSLKEVTIYTDGQMIKKDLFKYDSKYIAAIQEYQTGNNRQQELLKNKQQELNCDVEICPVPIGGLKVIQDNLIYPEHALLYGLEGEVVLNAKISEVGDVISTEVTKHLGLGCDDAAQDAVKKTKFIPGQNNGKNTLATVSIKVEYAIENKTFSDNTKNNEIENLNPEKKIVENENSEEKKNDDEIKNVIQQKAEIICKEADECPHPENGIKEINKNLSIPFIAKRLKLKGSIEIEAIIDKYGFAHEAKTIKGIGYGCDEAVESALMHTKFSPAKRNGEEIDSKILLIYPFNYEE
jgi:TonB family protein